VFFLRHPTDSLHSLDLYVTIPEVMEMEVSAKRFLFYPSCVPDTILQLLQMSETQNIKREKKTITTFGISLTPSHTKSPNS